MLTGHRASLTGRLGTHGILGYAQDIRNIHRNVQLEVHESWVMEKQRTGKEWVTHAWINRIFFKNAFTK